MRDAAMPTAVEISDRARADMALSHDRLPAQSYEDSFRQDKGVRCVLLAMFFVVFH